MYICVFVFMRVCVLQCWTLNLELHLCLTSVLPLSYIQSFSAVFLNILFSSNIYCDFQLTMEIISLVPVVWIVFLSLRKMKEATLSC